MQENLTIKLPFGEVLFTPQSHGMPEKIIVHEFDRDTVISCGAEFSLNIKGRGTVRPTVVNSEPLRFQTGNGAEALEFTNLSWIDSDGNIIP